jgi:hypothetical protein
MANKGNGGTLWMKRSYNFIDKDPEIDVFRTLYQKQRIRETDLAVLAGLSVTTVKKMFGGETRQPRHSTFGKLAGAMGQEYGLRPIREVDYKTEIPIAREQFKQHKERLKRLRARKEAKP